LSQQPRSVNGHEAQSRTADIVAGESDVFYCRRTRYIDRPYVQVFMC